MGAARNVQGVEPLQHVRAPAGRRESGRPTRRGRRPRGRRRDPPDADRLAQGPAPRRGGMTVGTPTLRGKRGRERRLGDTAGRAPGGGVRRQPDLSALLPLLASTGSFASLRERLTMPAGGSTSKARPTGRHVGLSTVPHGAKSYLAATLAATSAGERLAWIARDAEIGDRVAEELIAWLGDPAAVAVL